MLLCAVKGERIDDLENLALPPQFDLVKLHRHLETLGDLKLQGSSVHAVAAALRDLTPVTRQLVSEAEKLIRLVLVLPVSVAESERSFSALHRLKTWIRATMTQKRLTHLALSHVHKDLLDDADRKQMINDFIVKNSDRRCVFGNVL